MSSTALSAVCSDSEEALADVKAQSFCSNKTFFGDQVEQQNLF